MSDHQSIRDLPGPLVMGELGPEEARRLETHLGGCAGCGHEAGSFRLAHEHLLDLVTASETPPRALKNSLTAGRYAPAASRPAAGWRRGLSRLAVAAVVLLLVLEAAYVPGLLSDGEVAAATLEPTGRMPEAGGGVEIREGTGENVELRLDAWGLSPCESEEYYEIWFAEDGERVSAGTFSIGDSGDAEVGPNAPQFATSYPRIDVTVERDGDPRPSDTKMLGGEPRESRATR